MTDPISTPQTPPSSPDGQGQGQDYQALYTALQAQVSSGAIATEIIKSRIESGELFPKDRFAGLQTSLNNAVVAKEELARNLVISNSTLEAVKKQKEDFENSAKSLNDRVATIGADLTAAQMTAKRKTLILEQFPQLASFEKDGLLPSAGIEELPALLGSFASKLGQLGVEGARSLMNGATPPPPAENSTVITKDELYKLVVNASLGDKSQGSYEELYAKYLSMP